MEKTKLSASILAIAILFSLHQPDMSRSSDGTLTDKGQGEKYSLANDGKFVEYCLTEETDLEEGKFLTGSSQAQDSFPLYGSREERVFRQSATLFTYDGNFDNRLKKSFTIPKKEATTRTCVYVQESGTR